MTGHRNNYQKWRSLRLSAALVLCLAAFPVHAAVIQSASCSQQDIRTAVNSARPGDTVLVPAGTATWTSSLHITKGIILKGAGWDQTVINGNISDQNGGIIKYEPARPDLNEPFRLTGFTLDGRQTCNCVYIVNFSSHAVNRIRVDHNRIMNAGGNNAGRCVVIGGTVFGVLDSNIIQGFGKKIDVYGNGVQSWTGPEYDFGTADTMFYEDNEVITEDTPHSGGDGGRYCARFNVYRQPPKSLWPWFDAHGNMGPGGNYSMRGVEIYGNVIDAGIRDIQIDIRGGKAMVFDNRLNVSTGSGFIRVREEFDDSLNPPAVAPNGQPQHVSDSYFWGNTENGSKLFHAILGDENFNNALAENREFYNQYPDFDGSAGIGAGALADRPATCTPGVGYWSTDDGGDWNKKNATIKDGIFYKCTETNVWTPYFTPYTYPHPLRVSGPLADSVDQTIFLQAGWNWISFNVLPEDRSLDSIFGGIVGNMEQVRTQTRSALRLNGQWVGDLQNMDGIQAGMMYKVRVNAACTLTVSGTAIAVNIPIQLVGGWNWVAFYPSTHLPINEALSSIAGHVEQVRSQTQSAIYLNGQWIGDLAQMEPGKGYTIRMSGAGALIYPSGQ